MRYDNPNFLLTPPLMLINAQFITPKDYVLQPTHMDIWEFPLHFMPPLAPSLLNDKESERAQRFYFDHHRRRFTIARAMLRLILGRYLHHDPKQLIFNYNDYGKPQLEHSQDLRFNLSHSGDLALLAVGQHYDLGIDVEFFSARPYVGIARHLFSEQELDPFLLLPSYLKPQAFFHIWAQKEAFIKACGLGLAYPTKSITVPLFPPSDELIKDPLFQNEWQLTSFMPRLACNAALCRHPNIQSIAYIHLDSLFEFFKDSMCFL